MTTVECDRYWLLTWTMYGNWLPGDERGFVSNVRDGEGAEVRHNIPGTEFDRDMPNLERAARGSVVGTPVRIGSYHAEVLFEQFRETEAARGWRLFAVAIMSNHCHLTVGVAGDPDSGRILRDFKSYGSRKLNQQFTRPESGTWWTESGSRRKLPTQDSVYAAINYIVHQQFPLLVWTAAVPELGLKGGRIATREKGGGKFADE